MSPNDLDNELTRLFTEQRRADEASAPDFRELLVRARAGTRGRAFTPGREGRWAWRAAIAATASLALATGLYLFRPPPEPRLLSNVPTLAAWKAPTDALLQTPGAELLGQLPVLLPSIPGDDAGVEAPGAREATPRSTQTKVPYRKGVES
jgi:hypothetical protein